MSDENINEEIDGLKESIAKLEAQNSKLIGEKRNWTKDKAMHEQKQAELLDKMQGAEERRLFEAGNIDEAFNMKYHNTISKKDEMIREMENKLVNMTNSMDSMSVGNMARQAAIEAGVRPDAAEIMRMIVSEQYRMNDGKVSGFTSSGEDLLNEKGEPMGMGEFISSMATSHDYMFNKQAGAGSNGGGTHGSALKRENMSMEQKSDYISKHGQDGYEALPFK